MNLKMRVAVNPESVTPAADGLAEVPSDVSPRLVLGCCGDMRGGLGAEGAGVTMPPVHPVAPGPLPYTVLLPCLPESVGRARALVSRAFTAWGMPELIDEGKIIVSELLTNVVDHTSTALTTVAIERGSSHHVRIHVADASRMPPCLTELGSGAESGRGLHLIDDLSCRWGYDDRPWGKITWAELSTCLESDR
ncbi:ATP-binding protein [Streptomyces venezuelae]|uniref:ATP-binding protein n=1 Tax=Streptomyces venezuelae TaxID=54571 RepID=UPI003787C49D